LRASHEKSRSAEHWDELVATVVIFRKHDGHTETGKRSKTTAKDSPMKTNELNMIFQFDVVSVDRNGWRWKPWAWPTIKALYTPYDKALDCPQLEHCVSNQSR
ncbi:MAG: hypothetical protein ACRD8U_22995, partial [Pyrinomonadaceae bacterium]